MGFCKWMFLGSKGSQVSREIPDLFPILLLFSKTSREQNRNSKECIRLEMFSLLLFYLETLDHLFLNRFYKDLIW